MKNWRGTLAGLVLGAILPGAGLFQARALDPGQSPGGNFDLSHWKLTLPAGAAGHPVEVSPAQLAAGFTNGYFYGADDGAMTFWCPVNGVTTKGSSHPRSELRELLNPDDPGVNWNPGTGTHTLTAQCKVTQVAGQGKVVIGQIHGYNGKKARPMVKLQFEKGSVRALVKLNPASGKDTSFRFEHVGLGNLISYRIRVVDGNLSLTVNDSTRTADVSRWAGQACYFKAGDYCQDNVGDATNGARVCFYQLSASHATNSVPVVPEPSQTPGL